MQGMITVADTAAAVSIYAIMSMFYVGYSSIVFTGSLILFSSEEVLCRWGQTTRGYQLSLSVFFGFSLKYYVLTVIAH
jgi:hypothetical protein